MTDQFLPAWGLTNPHAQTVWPTLFLRTPELPVQVEEFVLPDGDFLELVWLPRDSNRRVEKVLLVLHGLEGSWRSPYCRSLLWCARQHGWTSVVMQFRGCGHRINRLDRTYHSGDTGDLRAVCDELERRFPSVPVYAVGYSLGGNALLKSLGETASPPSLARAAAVSVPLVLSESARRLERGGSRIYQWWFLRSLKKKLNQKFSRRSAAPISLARVRAARTMTEFDEAATAPLHGFDDAAHYYRDSSARQYLYRVTIPTLIIQSLDDPFMTAEVIPNEHELSPAVRLELTERGGHVGFVAPPAKGGFNWLGRRILRFFESSIPADQSPPSRPPATDPIS